MPRIIWLWCCAAAAITAQDNEIRKYTSPHPLLHNISIAAIAGWHTLHNTMTGHTQHSRARAYYTPQKPPQCEGSIQWLGHATALIRTAGHTILTDPVFYDIPFHTRYTPLGTYLHDLPNIDFILLSHDHYDHCDTHSLRQIRKQQAYKPTVLCPRGVGKILRACSYRYVYEADWWHSIDFREAPAPIGFTCVPAHHWSGRSPCLINTSLWGGWIIHGDHTYYFAGDTAYNYTLFHTIADNIDPIDVALLPIGPRKPYRFTRHHHMNAFDIRAAIQDLRYPPVVIGTHWGTFKLGPEMPEQPITDARKAQDGSEITAQRLRMLTVGGTYTLTHTSQHATQTLESDQQPD